MIMPRPCGLPVPHPHSVYQSADNTYFLLSFKEEGPVLVPWGGTEDAFILDDATSFAAVQKTSFTVDVTRQDVSEHAGPCGCVHGYACKCMLACMLVRVCACACVRVCVHILRASSYMCVGMHVYVCMLSFDCERVLVWIHACMRLGVWVWGPLGPGSRCVWGPFPKGCLVGLMTHEVITGPQVATLLGVFWLWQRSLRTLGN